MTDPLDNELGDWIATRRSDASSGKRGDLWADLEPQLAPPSRRTLPTVMQPTASRNILTVGGGAFAGALRCAVMLYIFFGIS